MRALIFGLIALTPTIAFAATPGIYCSDHAYGDGLLYFNGKTIEGEDWACDAKGTCDAEGNASHIDWHVIGYAPDKSLVLLVIDGKQYALPRCL